MTVTTNTNKVQALGNGVTKTFTYSFRIFSSSDLVVTSTDLTTGTDTPLVLNTDYTVTGAGSYNGGNVVLSGDAPDSNTRITIRRVIPVTQGTDLRNQGSYFAETHEDVFDRLTMIDQQQQESINRSVTLPASSSGVSPELPSASASKVIGWNAAGTALQNYGAVDNTLLALQLASSSGASMVGYGVDTIADILKSSVGKVVSSIADLKAVDSAKYSHACVTGYYAACDGGGGFYRYDSTDTTSLDNGGTIIVATDGGRWKLTNTDFLSLKQFGVKFDGTSEVANLAAFQAAINYCQDNLKTLYAPSNDPSDVIAVSGKLSVTKPMRFIGPGSNNLTIMGVGLAAGQTLFDVDGTAHGTFERAEISGFTLMPGAGADCMLVKNASASVVADISVRTCRHGIIYTGTRAFSNTFRKIAPVTAVTGETFRFVSHTGGGGHSFYDCTFGGSIGFSLDDTTVTDTINFYNPNFEQCTSYGASITGTVKGLVFSGGRTEGGNDIDILINPTAANIVTGLSINGVEFDASDNGAVTRIRLGGAGGKVRGFNISGNSVGHASNNFAAPFVTLNGDGESGTISGNYLNGSTASCSVVNTQRSGVVVYGNEGNNGKFAEAWGLSTWGVTQGTFTPIDSSGAGLTFTSANGVYTKIGRMVYWQANIVYPATANGSSSVIGGFPATVVSGSGSAGRAGGIVSATDSAVVGMLQMEGTTTIWPYKAGLVRATNADLSGKTLYLSGMYIA